MTNIYGLTNKQLLFGALRQLVQEALGDQGRLTDEAVVTCHIQRSTIERAVEVIAELDRPKDPANRKRRRRIPATGYATEP